MCICTLKNEIKQFTNYLHFSLQDVLKYTIQNTITNGLQANAYFYLSESTGELTLGSSLEKTQQNIIKVINLLTCPSLH